MVFCRNKSQGCDWTDKIKDYEQHEKACKFPQTQQVSTNVEPSSKTQIDPHKKRQPPNPKKPNTNQPPDKKRFKKNP